MDPGQNDGVKKNSSQATHVDWRSHLDRRNQPLASWILILLIHYIALTNKSRGTGKSSKCGERNRELA
jgi:hypothetical protein